MEPIIPTVRIIESKNVDKELLQHIDEKMCRMTSYVDFKKLRKVLNIKGGRIKDVYLYNTSSPEWVNKLNRKIPYKHAVCVSDFTDGAYEKTWKDEYNNLTCFVSDFPTGDAIVIVKNAIVL